MSKIDIDDGLTDEERAALSEDDGTPAEPQDAPDEVPAVITEDVNTPPADQGPAEEPVEASPQPAPILVAPALEDAAAKLAAIETQKESLLTQFDDGDITAREYQKQLDTLAKEERAIERAQDRAELASQIEQQRLQNEWTQTCNTFVETHAVYKDNPRLYKALDAEVRDLATRPDTANWSGQKFLEEAHKALKSAFGFAEPEAKAAKLAYNPAANLPPNLSKVPAAEVESTSGGRFAVLDRLASSDPIAYEESLAKMSQSERDAYLAS